MVITNIEEENEIYAIYIDNEYSYTLSKDIIIEYELDINKKIGYMENMYLEKKSIDYECINKAIKKLSYSSKTQKEIYNYLIGLDYSKDLVNRIIAKLKKIGYIDDFKYAYNYITYHNKNGLKSKNMALYGLKNKGVSSDIINRVIEELEVDDYDVVMKVIKKKIRIPEKIFDRKYEDKIKAFLYRKGFKINTISKAIKEFKNNIEDKYLG
ncbi:regulatory protein RecX [Abyssisolibacter fermentans]|uniref:regulatory protein RecX n=1 Tax=Abyssisolibacter fermentans TaxID=1766203 RepID=UPI0008349819|nr:RecX family transcriptional regulator [Abyssisolibacter fermentans]